MDETRIWLQCPTCSGEGGRGKYIPDGEWANEEMLRMMWPKNPKVTENCTPCPTCLAHFSDLDQAMREGTESCRIPINTVGIIVKIIDLRSMPGIVLDNLRIVSAECIFQSSIPIVRKVTEDMMHEILDAWDKREKKAELAKDMKEDKP